MTFKVQTNIGTHPAYPEWRTEGTFDTYAQAEKFIAEQSTAEGVDGLQSPTMFGNKGLRIFVYSHVHHASPQKETLDD